MNGRRGINNSDAFAELGAAAVSLHYVSHYTDYVRNTVEHWGFDHRIGYFISRHTRTVRARDHIITPGNTAYVYVDATGASADSPRPRQTQKFKNH